MPQIQLIGGELDGLTLPIPSVQARPEIYYAVPLIDEPVVRATKGTKARAAVRRKLGVLAYVYDKTVRKDQVGWEYQYLRRPDQDKAVPLDGAAQDAS
jgi:hypothetical protein